MTEKDYEISVMSRKLNKAENKAAKYLQMLSPETFTQVSYFFIKIYRN